MLGMATLTLGSSTAMVVQSQAQCATLTSAIGKALALPGCRRQSLSNRREAVPVGLLSSSTNNSFSLFFSFNGSRPTGPFTPAVAAVNSDHLSSSCPPNKKEANEYYIGAANAKFMLDEEEHFQELFFERFRNYGERKKF